MLGPRFGRDPCTSLFAWYSPVVWASWAIVGAMHSVAPPGLEVVNIQGDGCRHIAELDT